MKRSGYADLRYTAGTCLNGSQSGWGSSDLRSPEAVLAEYGKDDFLSRLADPFWFQSLGAVMGMDWHSSGITTSVMGALRRAVNPHSKELGIYFCGGKESNPGRPPMS